MSRSRFPILAIAVIVVILICTSQLGVSQPVDDFVPVEPDEDVPDEEVPEVVVEPEPIKYATFAFQFTVSGVVEGILTSVDATISDFVSLSEGRVYTLEPLLALPFPDPVETECTAYVIIRVTGGEIDAIWQSEDYRVTAFPGNFGGESGRVFFYDPGAYSYTATLTLETGIIGDTRVVATTSGVLVVSD